ncbi:ABC transporter ATP-binding protein [Anaeromicropila herbilytica]|uniref:Bacitracin ABC transporter ATP-binding protein n=1 Tax=Anaeromicropila herbilytica TaxID=2785025 RepID=A0A7R7EPM8_9FIRM|nr:ABC transporter ATP-binding protein [Anaeromicropila herbilytica]BCN32709.1 bacitracin ABC transporter ATP-binding protein [Anaeromicropila herbilytica]
MSMVLQTNNLTKRYGKQLALNKVNMNVEKGDIYGFIGRNGAGKTTLMKIASGLIRPSQGEITLFESKDLNRSRKRIGCVIEQPALYPGMTARQNLIYYNKLLGITDNHNVNEVLDLVGLHNTGRKKTKNFSLGMKQRLSIAISLLSNPDFLILDEPINGLDPSGIKEIRELIQKLNSENEITILISSHILGELAKIATKYGVIENGVMVDEFAATELEHRCKKCLSLEVNDTEKATYILKNKIQSTNFKVFDHGKICIYDCLDIPAQINKELISNDVLVSRVALDGQDIEAYFVKMMGGEM